MSDKLISRKGPNVGRSDERRLIEKVGGEDTIRKAYQTNLDGSKTMAHTRGEWSQPEVITTDPDPAKPPPDDGEWTYDYNPLRPSSGALVPDLEGVYPRNVPDKGAKTRRSGLKITGEAECMLAVSKSCYDIYDKDKYRRMVRGPNYWYDKRNVVTWASEIVVDETGDMTDYPFANRVGVVQYEDATGLHEITVIAQQGWGMNSVWMLAACMAKSADGARYVRVAFVSSGRIYVRDYRKGVAFATASWGYVGAMVDGVTLEKAGLRGFKLSEFSQDGLRLVTTIQVDAASLPSGVEHPGNQCLVLTMPPPGEVLAISPSLHTFNVEIKARDYREPTKQDYAPQPSATLAEIAQVTGSAGHNFQQITKTNERTGAVETFETDFDPLSYQYDYESTMHATGTSAGAGIPGVTSLLVSDLRLQTRCFISAVGFAKNGDVCGVVATYDYESGAETNGTKEVHWRKWWSDKQDLTYRTADPYNDDTYLNTGSWLSRRQETYSYLELTTTNAFERATTKTYYCAGASSTHLDQFDAEYNEETSISSVYSSDTTENQTYTYTDHFPFGPLYSASSSNHQSDGENTSTITVTLNESAPENNGPWHQGAPVAADFSAGVVAVRKTTTISRPGYICVVTNPRGTPAYSYTPADLPMTPSGKPDLYIGPGETELSLFRNGVPFAGTTGPFCGGYGDWWEKKKAYLTFRLIDDALGGWLYKKGSWYQLVRNPNEPAGAYPTIPPNISHY